MRAEDFDLVASTSSPSTTAQVKAVQQYWTAAKMKQAKPIEMPTITDEEFEEMAESVRATLHGLDSSSGMIAYPRLAGHMALAASSPIAKTEKVSNTSVYPFSPVLKMFMSFANGNSMGSAFIIGKRAVMTAGHCVCNRGTTQFASNIQYVPQYKNGSGAGTFTAVKTTCLKEWTQGSFAHDIGVSIVDKDFPEELGVAGYAINQILTPGKLRSIGYPAAAQPPFGFNGQEMWNSLGDYADDEDAGNGTTTERNFAHYNDMTQGCSGGPIFTDGPVPIVVGLNSHMRLQFANGPREVPHRMYSPYFGDAVKRLIKWLKENEGDPIEPGQGQQGGGGGGGGGGSTELKNGLIDVVKALNTLIAKLN
jgi:V8-like Glu-specific endopeptidase